MSRLVLCSLLIAAACSEKINRCDTSADCEDIAYPFCDVGGHYGDPGLCIVRPMNCPAEECGCTPGEASCSDGTQTICNADGMSATRVQCDLGCGDNNDHCAAYTPSHGIGEVLSDLPSLTPAVIPAGSTINTDTGLIEDSANTPYVINHMSVTQLNGANIQVFYASSFSIDAVTITGTLPAAFVATGPIDITGKIEAGGHMAVGGPGAKFDGPTVGTEGMVVAGQLGIQSGGGGGNATAGAGMFGGAASTSTALEGGGCGGQRSSAPGGGGGGAVQLFSLTSITIDGGINVGGGGGTNMGGGAGGTIVLEAPTVSLSGVLTANGGAGGTCNGQNSTPELMDGQYSAAPSTPPSCSFIYMGNTVTATGGKGGTGMAAPTTGTAYPVLMPSYAQYEGDGGAVGRVQIHTATGSYMSAGIPLVSAVVTTGQLEIH